MKTKHILIAIVIILLVSNLLIGIVAAAGLPWPKPEDWDLDILGQRDLIQAQEAFQLSGTSGLLFAPDSDNSRDHSSITAVDVSATPHILAASGMENELSIPAVLKSE